MSRARGSQRLALEGGAPVRARALPYGRQTIGASEGAAVLGALESDWLTCGPRVGSFERAFARRVGSAHAVALNSGTAALHAGLHALGVRAGDEVLVPALTFAATANAVHYLGARPVFCEVERDTLLLDVADAVARITPRTRAIVGVDYAGQACDWPVLRELAGWANLRLLADACHALGASVGEQRVGALADASAFSFHPVKAITTGEGGMLTTADAEVAARARVFRNHGIDSDAAQRERAGTYAYAQVELGFNYRLSDLQCALGESQLARLDSFLAARARIAAHYARELARVPAVRPLALRAGRTHAWHLYVVELELERLRVDREQIYRALRAEGIGVQVHYPPLHLHPYQRERLGGAPGDLPVCEAMARRVLSLPIHPSMSRGDASEVIEALAKVLAHYEKRSPAAGAKRASKPRRARSAA